MNFTKVTRGVFRALACTIQCYIKRNARASDNVHWVVDSYLGDPEWFCVHGLVPLGLTIEKLKPLAQHELITFTAKVYN
jgi:hypothetical protein